MLTPAQRIILFGGRFNPLLVGPDCWLDFSRLTGAGGDLVAAYTDLSGFGNSPAQATEANRPTVLLGGLNGRNVLDYGVVGTSYMEFTPFGTGTARSTFIVYKDGASADYTTFLGSSFTSTGMYHGTTGGNLFDASLTDPNTINGDNYLNGADIGDGTSTARPTTWSLLECISAGALAQTISHLGSDSFQPTIRRILGGIAEFITVPRIVTAGERNYLRAGLIKKWLPALL